MIDLVDRSDKRKMTEKPKPGSQAETRERILAAALDLFCERGFTAVGTQDICQLAGVMKGSLYHFFPSKLDVALTALHVYAQSMSQELKQVTASGGTPQQRLREIFIRTRNQARQQKQAKGLIHGCLHGHLVMELSLEEPHAKEALSRVTDLWVDSLVPLMTELREIYPHLHRDPRQLATAVLAYLHGVVLVAKAANNPELIVELADQLGPLLGLPSDGSLKA
jgi:TetR/AcrR family transcriptional repressor of nem operon